MSDLLVEKSEGGIVQITFNRPKKRNAINYSMWAGIADAFEDCENDREVRVIVLTGAGGCFSAGADISEFGELRSNAELGRAYDLAVERGARAMSETRKPVIAAVDGYCIGGGLGLAIACDFRFATPQSTFGIPAARLGIVYGSADTRNLMNLVGLSHAKRILMSAEFFDTARATQIGLVDECVEGDVLASVNDFAKKLAGNAPLSIAASKRLLNQMANPQEADILALEGTLVAQAMESRDYQEGVAAFGEKRPPKFIGE